MITYDYTVIDQCLAEMKSKAQWIQDRADHLKGEVKQIVVDWHGHTADAYEELATDLDNDLVAHRNNLDTLAGSLGEAAEKMREKDQNGARHLHNR